jgi:hypothetical protein
MAEALRENIDQFEFELARDNTRREDFVTGQHVELRGRPASQGYAVIDKGRHYIRVCPNENSKGKDNRVPTIVVDIEDVCSFPGELRAFTRLRLARERIKGRIRG